MTYIPGIGQPIPGTPIYNVTSTENLQSGQWPMIYTTDGPLQVGNGISFTNNSVSFDPSLVNGGIVQQIVAGTNISISPANGKGVVTISASSGPNPWTTVTGTANSGSDVAVYTTTLTNGSVLSLWGTLTVYSGANVMRTYTVQVLNTYNSLTGVAGQAIVNQTLTYTNPTAPEPTPSCAVAWQTGQGGGVVTLLAAPTNGNFNYSFTYTRLV